MSELMRLVNEKGVSISDGVADYCASKFEDFDRGYKKVSEFLERIENYSGENVLFNIEGYLDKTPRFGGKKIFSAERIERKIYLGNFEGVEFKRVSNRRNAFLEISKGQVYQDKKQWAEFDNAEFNIDCFLLNYEFMDGNPISEKIQKKIFGEDGLKFDISSRKCQDNGSIIHCDREPFKSIIFGKEAIQEYLETEKDRIVVESVAEIPEF